MVCPGVVELNPINGAGLEKQGRGEGGRILTGSYNMLYSKKSLFKSQQQRLRSQGGGSLWGVRGSVGGG